MMATKCRDFWEELPNIPKTKATFGECPVQNTNPKCSQAREGVVSEKEAVYHSSCKKKMAQTGRWLSQ